MSHSSFLLIVCEFEGVLIGFPTRVTEKKPTLLIPVFVKCIIRKLAHLCVDMQTTLTWRFSLTWIYTATKYTSSRFAYIYYAYNTTGSCQVGESRVFFYHIYFPSSKNNVTVFSLLLPRLAEDVLKTSVGLVCTAFRHLHFFRLLFSWKQSPKHKTLSVYYAQNCQSHYNLGYFLACTMLFSLKGNFTTLNTGLMMELKIALFSWQSHLCHEVFFCLEGCMS